MPIRVLIADDHEVFRTGLKALLAKESDIVVVAETGTGPETVIAVADRCIDVLILDITMPGLPGPGVARAVLEDRRDLAIVVLTMHDDEYYLREMFEIGVRGFVLKRSSADVLLQAIRAAHRGEQYVDPSLASHVISSYVGRAQRRVSTPKANVLSPREREVCLALAHGFTNAEIAKQLSISPRTVESHRMKIMSKLELKSRAEVVRFAIDHDLLRLG